MTDVSWSALGIAAISLLIYLWASRPRVASSEPEDEASDTTVDAPSTSKSMDPANGRAAALPSFAYEEDADSAYVKQPLAIPPPAMRIVYDEDAENEEPTQRHALFAVTSSARSDKGRRRRRNEDSILVREDHGLFVIADGMGGYRGGELASSLAVETIEQAFLSQTFDGLTHESIPTRASELARAIQMANEAIRGKAAEDRLLDGMGTTICAARFLPHKQRLYVGHVGDSRVYCLRDGRLQQMTSDHTMKEFGAEGVVAGHLSRAIGVWPTVPIDIILSKPRPGDIYLLCSDGLTKMVDDEQIGRVLSTYPPHEAAEQLISAANENGGDDNISAIVVSVSRVA